MPEDSSVHEFRPTFSRRDLFRMGAGVAAAGLAAKLSGKDTTSPELPLKPKPAIPETLPEDVLTSEELLKANIRIDSTDEVKLHLRKQVLNHKLFKDSAEGKNGGVAIVLVDGESLSWNAANKLKPDAREILIAGLSIKDAATRPKEELENYAQNTIERYKGILEYQTRMLDDIASGKEEIKVRNRIKEIEAQLKNVSSEQKKTLEADLKSTERRLERIQDGTEEIILQDYIEGSRALIEGAESLVGKDVEDVIEYLNNRSNNTGLFMQPANIEWRGLYEQFPEARDKTYLYICVGGESKPHPYQSFPSPNDLEVTKEEDYHVRFKGDKPFPSGYLSWHEVGHYKNDWSTSDNPEWHADEYALRGITQAWNYYQKTGDTSMYPFVFVTDEGITITKRPALQTETPKIF